MGRRADGWLPTLSYLDSPAAATEANQPIDHAAVAVAVGNRPRSAAC
ncbi:hypothetical protein ACFYWD_25280 [Streptomyces sp. NPDC003781]